MTVLPRISSLAVTDVDVAVSQPDALALLGLCGDEFAEGVFDRAAVRTRSLDLSEATLARTLQGRTATTEGQLFDYAVDAVEQLAVDPAEVGTVVTSSLYCLGGPTLAHRLVERFKMNRSTDKYHVVGVGCAGAVPLVRLVLPWLDHQPAKKALVVAAESMSGLLTRPADGEDRAKTVGAAIFGDGCAAAIIDKGTIGPAVLASSVHQIEGTLGVVRIELTDRDSYLHLERELPDLAATGLPSLIDEFLASAALTRADIDHWIVHPGGRRILDRVHDALDLSDAQIEASYDVLRGRGNVGTPSIFYVLHETINRRQPRTGERGLMVTLGPGVTVGLMLLEF